jgi:DNA-binding transcriptional ArsR family regulator
MPQLYLALDGFSPQQQALMESWLESELAHQSAADIHWKIADLSEADAVLQARQVQHHTDEKTINLLKDLPCRIFWMSDEQERVESLEQSKERFLMTLLELDAPMQMNGLRYVLAGLLVERYLAKEPMSGLWHVHAGSSLLAVVDFHRLKVAIRSDAHFLELQDCVWDRRSKQAKAPPSFAPYPMERLMWEYIRRSGRDVLPKRYWKQPVALRQLPRLPVVFMNEKELALINCLRQQAMTCTELSQALGLSMERTGHLLSALYFAGAITTRPVGFWMNMKQRLRLAKTPVFRDTTTTQGADGADTLLDPAPASVFLGQSSTLSKKRAP